MRKCVFSVKITPYDTYTYGNHSIDWYKMWFASGNIKIQVCIMRKNIQTKCSSNACFAV